MQAIILSFLILLSPMNFIEKETKSVLHYLVKEPKIKNEKAPLIILLHGVGSNEEDLFSFANQLPDNFLIVSARAPIVMSKGSYAWYNIDFSTGKPFIDKPMAEKSRGMIIQFIDELKQKYKFDEQQVYLCSFSQGAIMSYSVGLTRPDKVKGIAIMSGRLLDEVKPLIKSSDDLKKLKVFISHGVNDNVLNVNYAKEANTYLKTFGISASYHEYPEGHNISNAMLQDMISWLNKK